MFLLKHFLFLQFDRLKSEIKIMNKVDGIILKYMYDKSFNCLV